MTDLSFSAPFKTSPFAQRALTLLSLVSSLIACLIAAWTLHQPWTLITNPRWPWLLLALAGGVGGWSLRRLSAWLPDQAPSANSVPALSIRRQQIGLALVLLALLPVAWVVLRLWPDYTQWHGTLLPWLAALLLIMVGGGILRTVGESARGWGNEHKQTTAGRVHQPWQRWIELVLFLAIAALAVWARLYRLDEIPAALYVDETNASLDALYILEGRDSSPFGTGWYETPNGYIYYMAALYHTFGASYLTLKAASLLPALLTIPAVYWLGRMLFGPLAGLMAMFLLSVNRWHLTMSRWGWNELMPPLFQIVATGLLIRGLRERRALDYTAGGLVAGLMLYTYLSSRLALLTLALFALYWLWTDPDGPRRAWQRHGVGLSLFSITALAAMAPLLVTYITRPFLFFNRSLEISIFNEVAREASWAPLRENIWRHIQLFYQFGDPVGRQNLPGAPQLDPMTGALLAIGLAYALFAWRDRRRGLLWLWLLLAMAGGFLSELHVNSPFAPEYIISPNSYRTISAVIAVVLIAGDTLSRFVQSVGAVAPTVSLRRRGAVVGAGMGLAALLMTATWDLSFYFGPQANSVDVQNSFNQMETQVGQTVVEALEAGETVYLSPNFYNFSPLRFLVYGAVHGKQAGNPLEDPPFRLARPEVDLPLAAEGKGALLLLDLHYASLMDYVRGFYPQAEAHTVQGPGGVDLFWQVRIPLADLQALQGLRRTRITQDGHRQTELVSDFALPASGAMREVIWEGTVQLPQSGVYAFGVTSAQLFIDGAPWTLPRYLGRGRHQIRVQQTAEFAQTPTLTWQRPGHQPEPLPATALFTLSGAQQGLTGFYFEGENWEGAPIFWQTTPFLLLSWPPSEPLPHPFSAIFMGALQIEEEGSYRFRLSADDGVRFTLDGKILGESLVPDQPNLLEVQAILSPGLHELRIDYFQRYGGSALEFFWQPPGQSEAPVPPSVLVPHPVIP